MDTRTWTELELDVEDVGKIALLGYDGDYVLAMGDTVDDAIAEHNQLNNNVGADMITADNIGRGGCWGDLVAVQIEEA